MTEQVIASLDDHETGRVDGQPTREIYYRQPMQVLADVVFRDPALKVGDAIDPLPSGTEVIHSECYCASAIPIQGKAFSFTVMARAADSLEHYNLGVCHAHQLIGPVGFFSYRGPFAEELKRDFDANILLGDEHCLWRAMNSFAVPRVVIAAQENARQ